MNFGASALPTRLTCIANRTIRVFRKMGKRIMTAFSRVETLRATAAAPSLGAVLGLAAGLP